MIGLTQDDKTLVLFTVDDAGSSKGMSVVEAANFCSPIMMFTTHSTATEAARRPLQWRTPRRTSIPC